MRATIGTRSALLACCALMPFALSWSGVARAGGSAVEHSPSRYVLDYRVEGPGCPSSEELKSLVAARVGRDPFVAEGARVVSITRAVRPDGTLEITVSTAGERGQAPLSKAFRGGSRECTELVQRAALTVALLVDEEPQKKAPEAPKPLEPPPSVKPSEPAREPPRPVEPPHALPTVEVPSSTGIGLSIAGHAGAAALHPSAAFEVLALRRFGSWSLGLLGRVGLPTSDSFPEGLVSTTTLAAGPLVCVGGRRADVCLPVTFGALLGSGGDTAEARTDASPFVTFGVRPELHVIPFGAFELTVFAEAYVAPARTSFAFRSGTAWSSAPLGGLLGLTGKLGLF